MAPFSLPATLAPQGVAGIAGAASRLLSHATDALASAAVTPKVTDAPQALGGSNQQVRCASSGKPSKRKGFGSLLADVDEVAKKDEASQKDAAALTEDSEAGIFDALRIYQLVRSFQTRGYFHANLDPLNLPRTSPYMTVPASEHYTTPPDHRLYGFTDDDLDRKFDCRIPHLEGFLSSEREPITLRQLIGRLNETYCGTIGVEYRHIDNHKVLNFIRKRFETAEKFQFSERMRQRILTRTMRSQMFEGFCQSKFPTTKRFGLDGCETMIVFMKELTKRASAHGVNSVVIGMPHRGRLNLLMNVMHKPLPQIVAEFRGQTGFGIADWGNIGDVKYHLGVDFKHFDKDSDREMRMCVLPNPSHLEAIDPLVVGMARAQQYYSGDTEKRQALPVIFHGDASIAGQGVVYETVQMSKLGGYSVGGTVHVIVNNQIGFTTNVADSGSGKTCASIARAIDAPIFHVNADDPEAVTFVAQVAFDYRQEFASDVFINLVGYRRYGHNELDMPKFTQPKMYSLIDKHPRVLERYARRLIDAGAITPEFFEAKKKETLDFYNKQYDQAKSYDPKGNKQEYAPQWRNMSRPGDNCPPRNTGVELEKLKTIGEKVSTLPSDFSAHPTVAKVYEGRVKAIKSGSHVDFGLAETLAYATLLSDGFHVRIAGQDVQRGTFSHRHAVVHDQKETTKKYCPLQNLKTPHKFEIHNSLLSEYGALGFEFGYAMEHPDSMVIWEAQFGDFANGAQIVIDQFIASAEVKWGRQNGIVLLLPHGYDGMGPEHSSARLERFLQLADDREEVIHPENWNVAKRSVIQKHNMQVVVPSTPAQHFHLLRRQMIRGFRKPLVVMSPKKLLKLRAAVSDMSELAEGTAFQRYLPNAKDKNTPDNSKIERVILCSGQIYYDLIAEREKRKMHNVAISRCEQISPFPFDRFIDELKSYPNVKDVVWAQEEPMNAGAWGYVSKRIASSLESMGKPNGIEKAIYVGRDVAGAPACGDAGLHNLELETLLNDAFDLSRKQNSWYQLYIKEGK